MGSVVSAIWEAPVKALDKAGRYPEGYDARVHGPYRPSRYYGKVDTKFTQVKLKELPQWVLRRNITPVSMIWAGRRAYHRYLDRYINVRRGGGLIPMAHGAFITFVFCYIAFHNRHYAHRHAKYH